MIYEKEICLTEGHTLIVKGKPLTNRTYYECKICGKVLRRGNDLLPNERDHNDNPS